MDDFDKQIAAFSNEIESELQTGDLNFPTVLNLSLRIKQVADDPDSSLDELAKLIRIEPLLSARLLQVANSVTFNPWGNNVSNVSEAIQRVGIVNVRVTALTVSAAQLAQEQRSPEMRELAHEAWRHSIDVAAWAQAIARNLKVDNPDTALLAGLMTDIGQIFLIARATRYPAMASDLKRFSELVSKWNRDLTCKILKSMGLPTDILDALDTEPPYVGNWPPETLQEVLFVSGLAADADNPYDTLKGEVRRKLLEIAKFKLNESKFDELLCDAEVERNELLNVLKA